ncbi:MAG: FAD-binding oxidoreductase [Nitrospinota bacterium]|nr:MAG: FAD-binding oxidoreductase [Nitrospinota bacterium]
MGGETILETATVEAFKTCLRGEVLTPSDAGYDEARLLWNGMHDKHPALIARCTGVADVIDAVNFARTHHLVVAVRGGGHNVAGTASCDGGIMIDLSLMKGIRVDPESRTVYAQGGATWGDVDRETQVFGLATPGGVVSTTGIAGLTLGGGLGWLRRKHGLSIDNVLSVDIVTADGQFHTASATQNADLFWGIRGGGGNFGVVTSFVYRLHPVGPMVTLCAPWYPVETAKEVLPAWRDFMASAPEELSSQALFWTVPPVSDFPEEAHGKRVVIPAAVYSGPADEGERVVQPLRELGTPLVDLSGPIPWTVLQSAFDPFFPKGEQLYYFKSRYLNDLNDATIDAIIPQASNPPQPMVLVVLWHNGGAMSRVGPEETAFMGRDAPYLLSVDAIWNNPQDTAEVITYARDFLAAMTPYSPGGLYVNFAGLGEEGDALVRSAYGANYARLVALKNTYDPTNLFRLNQNIAPTV